MLPITQQLGKNTNVRTVTRLLLREFAFDELISREAILRKFGS